MHIKQLLSSKVANASCWYTVTEFFLKGISFLTIPIFTRLLSPADYGIVSLYTTWVGVLTILFGMELGSSITKAKFKYKENFNDYVNNIILLSFLIFVILFCIFLGLKNYLISFTEINENLYFFMLIQSYFSFVRIALITKLRVEYKYKLLSMFLILTSIIGEGLSLILILYRFQKQPYMGRILGAAIPIIAVGVYILFYFLKSSYKKPIRIDYWKFALLFSIPIIGSSLSNLINNQFDRLIINQYLGESATGIYSFACNIGLGMQVIVSAVDQAWTPWIYEKMDRKEYKLIEKRTPLYSKVIIVLFSLFLFLSPEIVKFMADSRYHDAINVIPYILIGYCFFYLYTLELKTVFFFGKTSMLTAATFFACIVNVVLNLILIPQYGYIAAALTTAIAYAIQFISYHYISRIIIKKTFYHGKFYLNFLLQISFITIFFICFKDFMFLRIGALLIITGFSAKKILKAY